MVRRIFFSGAVMMHSDSGSLVPSRARLVVALASAALVGAVVTVIGGCSATLENPPSTTPGCDSSKCAAGNTCIKIGEETKCRKTCESNSDASKACPFGYTCTALAAQDTPCTGAQCYCAEAAYAGVTTPAAKIQKKDKGQWAFACNPTGGIAANADCDSAQGFQCYARNPSDGAAYCTRACANDNECGAGMFCGEVNDNPNAEVAKRSGNGTIKICQKRDYCAPCKASVDCPGGQVCAFAGAPDAFCTLPCSRDTECAVDAACIDIGGKNMCYPNAGTCLGDGNLCSPCRSDTDCKAGGGICASSSAYTTEKFCTVPSPSKCKSKDCPAAPPGVTGGCAAEAFDDIPGGSCLGTFRLGSNPIPGCYTRPRR